MAKAKDEVTVVEAPASEVVSPEVKVEAPVVEVKAASAKKFAFKVLGGKYHTVSKVYTVGDVVETDEDLVAVFGAPKFERVSS